MNTPKTIEQACKSLQDLIEKVAKEINQTGLFGEIHLEAEDGWSWDTVVQLKLRMPNGGIYDTGYSISPVMEDVTISPLLKRVLEAEPRMEIVYYVQHEELTRGVKKLTSLQPRIWSGFFFVWRYPDGSGEPDTYDLVDDFNTKSPSAAVKKMILLYIELTINQMYEAMDEEELSKQMELADAEMERWHHFS